MAGPALSGSPVARTLSRLVVFDGGGFTGARVPGGQVDFGSAVFSGGMVGFGYAGFSGGTFNFSLAVFSGGGVPR